MRFSFWRKKNHSITLYHEGLSAFQLAVSLFSKWESCTRQDIFCFTTYPVLLTTCPLSTSLRYYAALKTMEQLETFYIPRVSHYRFCQIMAETLPKLRDEIKDVSMSDLKDFLESIRKHSDKIGETAMRQVRLPAVRNCQMLICPLYVIVHFAAYSFPKIKVFFFCQIYKA